MCKHSLRLVAVVLISFGLALTVALVQGFPSYARPLLEAPPQIELGARTLHVAPGESIQAAIDALPETDGGTIVLESGAVYVQHGITITTKAVTVTTDGPDPATIDANDQGRQFYVNGHGVWGPWANDRMPLILENLRLINGNGLAEEAFRGNGGCVDAYYAQLHVSNLEFRHCNGGTSGGIHAMHSTTIIRNSAFYENSSDNRGGGAGISYTPYMYIENTEFISNTASSGAGFNVLSYDGMGYQGRDFSATVRNVTVKNNDAATLGTGVHIAWIPTGTMRILDSVFVNNVVTTTTEYAEAGDIHDVFLYEAHVLHDAGTEVGAVILWPGSTWTELAEVYLPLVIQGE